MKNINTEDISVETNSEKPIEESGKIKKSKRISFVSDFKNHIEDIIICTICQKKIILNTEIHPLLRVLVCDECFRRTKAIYETFSNTDGSFCRWCMGKNSLIKCSECKISNFCRQCLELNIDDGYLEILNEDLTEWRCCLCRPELINIHKRQCFAVIDYVERKRKESPKSKTDNDTIDKINQNDANTWFDHKFSDQNDDTLSKKIRHHKFRNRIVVDILPSGEYVLLSETLSKYFARHQIDGLKHLCRNTFHDKCSNSNSKPRGSILAHHMGLGKSVQTIGLLEIGFNYFNIKTALILAPLSVCSHWEAQFDKWFENKEIPLYYVSKSTTKMNRIKKAKDWFTNGGVMIVSYCQYTTFLSTPCQEFKKSSVCFTPEYLTDPGPEIIICDEGHMINNTSTQIYSSLINVKTHRRIVLTGTPYQNNLMEYYYLIEFVQPGHLGSIDIFKNYFLKSISAGESSDAPPEIVKHMKKAAYVLNLHCQSIIHRKGSDIISNHLPRKYEYFILVRSTELQISLYRKYIDTFIDTKSAKENSIKGGCLFNMFCAFNLIGMHPGLLFMNNVTDEKFIFADVENSKTNNKSNFNYESIDHQKDENQWYSKIFVNEKKFRPMELFPKLSILSSILFITIRRNEKLVIFSQSISCLNLIELFLKRQLFNPHYHYNCVWEFNKNYFRIDGSVSFSDRTDILKMFNGQPDNEFSVMLISLKVGSLGIDLTAANRVVLMDCSWNPIRDQQALSRIYRIGQTRNCYIYRLINEGVMEHIIYKRQIRKLSAGQMLIDQNHCAPKFTSKELSKLFEINSSREPLRHRVSEIKYPGIANIINFCRRHVIDFNFQSSQLSNSPCDDLTEEEKTEAYNDYKKIRYFDAVHKLV